jgi:hypothetical protein
MPNRMFMHAATSEGYVHNDFKRPYTSKTVFELFEVTVESVVAEVPLNRILAVLSRGQRAPAIPGVSKRVPPNNNTNNIRVRPRLCIKAYLPLKWL